MPPLPSLSVLSPSPWPVHAVPPPPKCGQGGSRGHHPPCSLSSQNSQRERSLPHAARLLLPAWGQCSLTPCRIRPCLCTRGTGWHRGQGPHPAQRPLQGLTPCAKHPWGPQSSFLQPSSLPSTTPLPLTSSSAPSGLRCKVPSLGSLSPPSLGSHVLPFTALSCMCGDSLLNQRSPHYLHEGGARWASAVGISPGPSTVPATQQALTLLGCTETNRGLLSGSAII